MRKDAAVRLLEIADSLERDAEVAAAYGLQVTGKLLRMARLDLLCQVHGISDDELRAISSELDRRHAMSNSTTDGSRFKLPH